MRNGNIGRSLLIAAVLASLAACATVTTSSKAPKFDKGARWAVLPAVNNTETPQAAARLEAISASLLRAGGLSDVVVYPPAAADDVLSPADRRAQEAALAWARSQNARYALAGAVQEWRYKTGLDGEPAAGITLSVIEVSSGNVVWTGTGARTGWSREAVAAVAQQLTEQLIEEALSRAHGKSGKTVAKAGDADGSKNDNSGQKLSKKDQKKAAKQAAQKSLPATEPAAAPDNTPSPPASSSAPAPVAAPTAISAP